MAYGEIASVRGAGGRRPAEHELRQEMVRVSRLMWERGYVASTDGNLSARLGSNRLLVTASGLSKGFLSVDDLVVIDLDGEPISSYRNREQRASSETLLHLEVYRQRPDVEAVVHAHPPLATAFSIAGVSLARCVIPEVVVSLGGIPTAEYATPGTMEVPESIGPAIREYDAVILAHHGSLTIGGSLWEAYLRLERVEQAAQITLAAQQLGQVRTLSAGDVERLSEKRRELLQRQGRDLCADCSVCLLGDNYQVPGDFPCDLPAMGSRALDEGVLVRQIAQSVARAIQKP